MSQELEGYLKKLGEKGPRKTWKKRWFLQRGSRIYYYERQTDVVEKGFVNLEEALSVVPSSDGKKSFAFQIHTPRRIYFLQAETEEAMKYWINGVKKSLQNLQKKEEEEERGGTRLSMRLNTAKNRVVDLERELEIVKKALDLACKAAGEPTEVFITAAKKGTEPKLTNKKAPEPKREESKKESPKQEAKAESSTKATAKESKEGEPASEQSQAATTAVVRDHFGARVLYDYTAKQEYELTIKENELITVLSKHENGWWLGCNHAGKQGYFPGSYVKPLLSNEV